MNEFDTENGFITPKEAKELLHITDKTLRIWAEEGKIGCVKTLQTTPLSVGPLYISTPVEKWEEGINVAVNIYSYKIEIYIRR